MEKIIKGKGFVALKELVEVLKYQRHDILNHMQVLLGYLKLGRYEQCEEYIKRFIDQTTRDSLVSALGNDSLAAFLLSFNALNRDLILEVEIPQPFSFAKMPGKRDALCRWIISLVLSYRDYAGNNQGEPNHLILTLHVQDSSLQVTTDYKGPLHEEWEGKFQELQEEACALGGQLMDSSRDVEESFTEWFFK